MALGEKSIVVDENDNVICYKLRSDTTKNDRIRMVAIWIENSKGQALIHKRSQQKRNWPGYWENAAAGGVAHDETYEQAAYKEAEEEIGLKGVELKFVDKTCIKTPNGERMCGWYKAVIDWPIDKFTPEPKEVEKIVWIDKSKLFNDYEKNPNKYMPSSKLWRQLFSK
jgi:isopentenyldiphosphate isomerase